jgi:hypothetical protein
MVEAVVGSFIMPENVRGSKLKLHKDYLNARIAGTM